jgi:hypothetical protein
VMPAARLLLLLLRRAPLRCLGAAANRTSRSSKSSNPHASSPSPSPKSYQLDHLLLLLLLLLRLLLPLCELNAPAPTGAAAAAEELTPPAAASVYVGCMLRIIFLRLGPPSCSRGPPARAYSQHCCSGQAEQLGSCFVHSTCKQVRYKNTASAVHGVVVGLMYRVQGARLWFQLTIEHCNTNTTAALLL